MSSLSIYMCVVNCGIDKKNVRKEFLKFSETRLTLITLDRLDGVVLTFVDFLLFDELTISVRVVLHVLLISTVLLEVSLK